MAKTWRPWRSQRFLFAGGSQRRCTIAVMNHAIRALAAGILLLGAGCNFRYRFTVNLAPGYAGNVSVICRAIVHTDVTAQADPQGRASASCPTRGPKLFVYRDGKEISASDVKWLKIGDGIVTGLSFSVR